MTDSGVLGGVAFLLLLAVGCGTLAYFYLDNDRISNAALLAAMAFGALAVFVFLIGQVTR